MRMTLIRSALVLGMLFAGAGGAASAADVSDVETLRDWQVENPMTAGITKGLTLGIFPASRYGEGAVRASIYDPYGMPNSVYRELVSHGRLSHGFGQGIGLSFWAFVFGGVFYRHLHTLKAEKLERSHAG